MNTKRQLPGRRALPVRGFTIIEIMTAMVIFGMVVAAIFATWSAVTRGAVSGNRAVAAAQRSRIALQQLQQALGGTRSFVADVQYYTLRRKTAPSRI